MTGGTFLKVIVLFLIAAPAAAAPHKSSVRPATLGQYVRSGVVVGGAAGTAFSILRMQKTKGEDGAERLVILYGDAQGAPVKTEPGYFHVNVDETTSRVSIDLAQVQKTAVDAKELARMFESSKVVAGTEMTMDPIDLSTNILLNLKGPAEIKTSVESHKGARTLVIDLRPMTSGARGG